MAPRRRDNELSESDKKWTSDLNQYVPKTKLEASAKFECKVYWCVLEFGKSCASRWEAINIGGTNWGTNRLCHGCESGKARYNLLKEASKEEASKEEATAPETGTIRKSKRCSGKKRSDGAPCGRWAKSDSDYCYIHFSGSL